MGVWGYGSMGVWGYGSMGVWEYGSKFPLTLPYIHTILPCAHTPIRPYFHIPIPVL
ncbi:MAG TPA: hypothetical protein VNM22_07130 [Candidatus Limnocylindrales bacterium]|nr:hypothetical protein [Candidatus Limnocylindrales bacterium]